MRESRAFTSSDASAPQPQKDGAMKTLLLIGTLTLAVGSLVVLAERNVMTEPMALAAGRLPTEGETLPIDGATAWLNAEPLTAAELRGKVVLLEFWTYSCINWLRVHPYVRAWSESTRTVA